MSENNIGVDLLDFLHEIYNMVHSPTSCDVDELLQLIAMKKVEAVQPVGFRVLVCHGDAEADSLAKKLSNSKDGQLIMMTEGEMIAAQDPYRVFVLRSN